jgi:hypothetical protein
MAKFVHFIRQKSSLSSPTFNHTRLRYQFGFWIAVEGRE